MSGFENVQNQLHMMLRSYVEDEGAIREENIGGEIPYPVFIIFVGDQICKEAVSDIIPEMRHHWPISFGSAGRGKLLYLLIDRNPDTTVEEGCGIHCCLTSPEPLKSLADHTEDCREVNNSILKAFQSANTAMGAMNMRLIAVTSIDDPDSLITGEVLALARQFGRSVLQQINEGELFAYLPNRQTLQEEGYRQSYDFFVKWRDWTNEKGSFPDIFMRFGRVARPITSGVPAISQTYFFDCVDNRGIVDSANWRNRLLADVLEIPRPVGNSVYIPGNVEDKLNYEYVLIKAMNPENWKKSTEREEFVWRSAEELKALMEKAITGRDGDEVEQNIQKWLRRACITRVGDIGKNGFFAIEKIEKLCFGTSVQQMFSEFIKEFSQRRVPGSILEQIMDLKGERRLEAAMDCLQDLIEQTRSDFPDRADYSVEGSLIPYNGMWNFKAEKIDPSYMRLAPACTEALIHRWAVECRNLLSQKSEAGRNSIDVMSVFTDIYRHEEIFESSYWSDVPYDGPEMRALSEREADAYKKAVGDLMEDPSKSNLYKLFRIVKNRITNENYPPLNRIRASCHTTHLFALKNDGGGTVIRNGVSRGRQITFTVVPNLDFVRFLYECKEEYSENEA